MLSVARWEERYVATEMFRQLAKDYGSCFVRNRMSGQCRLAVLLEDIERELMECSDADWPSNVVVFHKAIAEMIAALDTGASAQSQSRSQPSSSLHRTQVTWLESLMAPTNREFEQRIAALSGLRLADLKTLRQFSTILQANVRVLEIVGKYVRTKH